MTSNIETLIVDDEPIVCERLKEFLVSKGVGVETFTDSESAMARMREKSFDVVITDLKMEGPTGIDILKFIRDEQPGTRGILITAYGVIESVREAQIIDAFEVVHKPFRMEQIHKLVIKAARAARRRRSADR